MYQTSAIFYTAVAALGSRCFEVISRRQNSLRPRSVYALKSVYSCLGTEHPQTQISLCIKICILLPRNITAIDPDLLTH